MKILSLFDGISIAQQAFKELGFEVEYYASEIDKYAIQITKKNHPNTEQLGDIKDIDCTGGLLHYGKGRLAETDIYFLIGGSPCQDLSIAKKNREGLNGKRSGLFWEYVRILKELKPKYFILENVASMPKEAKQTITETLWDIEPVMINASLVSAQNRKRLFWVGKLADKRHIGHWDSADYEKVNISQPHDEGILLKDILEDNANESYSVYNTWGVASRTRNGKKQIEHNGLEKANAMTSVQTDSMVDVGNVIRKFTPIECERLQSLPDNYTEGISNTQRYKTLGNGFNCAVIKHIIKSIL